MRREALHTQLKAIQNRHEEAAGVEERFQKVWQKADLRITTSCLCQPAG
jgi:hypothetical protein